MSKGWDTATLKKLKALSAKGLSTAEIGKKLGMSKNAVVGKLNRLGWNSKAGGVPVVGENTSFVKKAKPAPATVSASKTKKTIVVVEKTKKIKKVVEPKKVLKPVKPVKKEVVNTKKTPVVKATKEKQTKKENLSSFSANAGSKKNLDVHQRIIQHSLEFANLKPDQCRWPIGDPDSGNFHFCGEKVFAGKPYCYKHCKDAYQFAPLKKK